LNLFSALTQSANTPKRPAKGGTQRTRRNKSLPETRFPRKNAARTQPGVLEQGEARLSAAKRVSLIAARTVEPEIIPRSTSSAGPSPAPTIANEHAKQLNDQQNRPERRETLPPLRSQSEVGLAKRN